MNKLPNSIIYSRIRIERVFYIKDFSFFCISNTSFLLLPPFLYKMIYLSYTLKFKIRQSKDNNKRAYHISQDEFKIRHFILSIRYALIL